ELFEREAKVLATLKHPAIPKYLNYFHCDTESDRYFYLVQELVEGDSLAALIEGGWKVNEQQVKYIARQVLEILKYLHSLHPPVIHRDIKPQNIIVRPDNKVYLVDFGAVQEIYRNTLSFGGTFVGTMGYISPEQFRGKVSPASDLYSLGCTLLFVLTRRSPTDLPQKRMRFDFRDRLSLSSAFADWLEKMVEPASEDRFVSSEKALRALQQKYALNVAKKAPLKTNYQFRRIRKPLNTRVMLERSDRHLSLKIPPAITSWTEIANVGNGIAVLLFLFFGFRTFWVSISLGFPLLPFLTIFFICVLVGWGIYQFRHAIEFDMNSESFSITKSIFKYQSKITGSTRGITFVELGYSKSKNTPTFYCSIWEGHKERRISQNLSKSEMSWIVEEISDFLEGLKRQAV
ncbi:MAG: serine/threonine protein kinase, partial [Spirulina sp.]